MRIVLIAAAALSLAACSGEAEKAEHADEATMTPETKEEAQTTMEGAAADAQAAADQAAAEMAAQAGVAPSPAPTTPPPAAPAEEPAHAPGH